MNKRFAVLFSTVVIFLSFNQVFAHGGHDHDHGKPDVHLSFSNGTHAHLFWEALPKVGEAASLRVEFKKATDHSATEILEQLTAELWMPSMGHGSAPTLVQRVTDASGKAVTGAYRISNMFFIMGGEWEVRLTLNGADGSSETRKFILNMAEEGGEDGHHHGH